MCLERPVKGLVDGIETSSEVTECGNTVLSQQGTVLLYLLYSKLICLLGGLLGSSSLLSSLGLQLSVNVSLAESLKDGNLSVSVGDLSSGNGHLSPLDWDDILVSVLSNVCELSLGGVALLGLATLGEHNELSLVLLNAVDVDGDGRLRLVSASSIHGDSDGTGEFLGNTSLLQLNGGETATLADLEVVSLSGWNHNRSQQTSNWSWENSGSLGLTGESSGLVTSRLVEPSSNIGVVLNEDITDRITRSHTFFS
jgi:hypothetical protein